MFYILGAGLAGASLLSRGGRGNSGGYNGGHYRGYRGRRALTSQSEQIFAEMEALDAVDDCGKLFLCQLATENAEKMSKNEQELIKALKAPEAKFRIESAVAPFQAALELGFKYKSKAKCNTRYARCLL